MPTIRSVPGPREAAAAAATIVAETVRQAVASRGHAVIVLCGGQDVPATLAELARREDDEPLASRFEFDAHMTVCPHCVIYMESYLKTIALGRDAFADPKAAVPEDIPKDLVDAIMAAREKGGA